MVSKSSKFILWFKDISHKDVPLVGGKNASLGEMYANLTKKGVNVPNGFAITTKAYWHFIKESGLKEKIKDIFKDLDVDNVKNLQERGKRVRNLVLKSSLPKDLEKEIISHYHQLSRQYGKSNIDVAVRTSATAEDLPSASFAGQYWTYLNVKGEKNLLDKIKGCLASLFTDRAIFYRVQHRFGQLDIALSIGVQKMVRSDLAASGIMFTLDTESGFRNVVLIEASYGLGEMIVQGEVTPDEFYVFKPTLKKGYRAIISKTLSTKDKKFVYDKNGGIKEVRVAKRDRNKFAIKDNDILTLAKWGCIIEDHYSKKAGRWMPQDIEWAKDGITGQLFIVQARPETIHSKGVQKYYEEYSIKTAEEPILYGIAIGDKVGKGKVRIIESARKIGDFKKGEVLVTRMTDPDWVPLMKIASAIITDEGSKTCHAAIVSRELGIPCVVGTGKATEILKTGQEVTVDCSKGLNGKIYKGKIPYKVKRYNLEKIPKLPVKISVNIGAPEIAFKTSFLPVSGVGLAREEFIIAEKIRIHPLALYYYKEIRNPKSEIRNKSQIPKPKIQKIIRQIEEITVEHKDKKEYFIKELAEGVATIGAAFYPREVIVRFSDFKTNEYAQLIGGELFEPKEENPMLGWRGASRYYDPRFKPAFLMEIEAIKRVRDIFGLKNIAVMVPFCRTVEEGKKVLNILQEQKFISAVRAAKRKKNEPKVYVMCEIPSNVILAEEFLKLFDGMSLGTNDLLQTTLGIDRDNARLSKITDETNEAVKRSVARVIKLTNKKGKYSGICGDAPSTIPEFAQFLLDCKIESISLSPDAVIKTILLLAKKRKPK